MAADKAKPKVPSVDARCHCNKCAARTTDVYLMIGRCGNCKQDGIVVLNRSGDNVYRVNCPVCGVYGKVEQYRLATPGEETDPAAEDD